MMKNPLFLDRWLISSEAAYASLCGFWRIEAGPGSLLDWRLENGFVERISTDHITSRIDDLACDEMPHIMLVVDQADSALLRAVSRRSKSRQINLVEWRQNPLEAVLRMNAPDHAILAELRDSSEGAGLLSEAEDIPNLESYLVSLAQWEDHCRTGDNAMFSETYPNYASISIPWQRLILQSYATPAANDNWIELIQLAAATREDSGRPFSFDDPRNTPAQWRLTLTPVDNGPKTLIVFRANEAALSSFIGQRIQVRARGRIIDLGEVDNEGYAEMLLPYPMEMQGLSISWSETE